MAQTAAAAAAAAPQQAAAKRAAAQPMDQLSYVHPRKPGSKVHFCSSCVFPIAVYGRLLPCMHAFCLSCATEMANCYICGSTIYRIERIPQTSGLHISAATLQSFKSAEQLAKHTRNVQTALSKKTQVGVPAPSYATRQGGQQQQHQPQQQQQQQGGGGQPAGRGPPPRAAAGAGAAAATATAAMPPPG